MSKEELIKSLQLLKSKYPDKLRIIRTPNDLASIDMDRAMETEMPKTFGYYDVRLINYISEQLSSGNEVEIQEGGKDELIVWAARKCFR